MNVEEARNVRIVLACEAILLAAAETGDPRDRGAKLGYLLVDLILAVQAEMPCYTFEGVICEDALRTGDEACPSCQAREKLQVPA